MRVIVAICFICIVYIVIRQCIIKRELHKKPNKERVAILYSGNIDIDVWTQIWTNHIELFGTLFGNVEMDIFFVVNNTEPTELLINDFYKKRTKNIICTDTARSWKKTSVQPLTKMSAEYFEIFEKRLLSRGLVIPEDKKWNQNVEQYHKLAIAIQLKMEEEERLGICYTKCVRIRPDIMINRPGMLKIKSMMTNDQYVVHITDLFLVIGSNDINNLKTILDEFYSLDESITNTFYRWGQQSLESTRLWPEVQFLTVLSKYSPGGVYDTSWTPNSGKQINEYVTIIRHGQCMDTWYT